MFDVIGNGEMPPEDSKVQLADVENAQIVNWLSGEIQLVSQIHRSKQIRFLALELLIRFNEGRPLGIQSIGLATCVQ